MAPFSDEFLFIEMANKVLVILRTILILVCSLKHSIIYIPPLCRLCFGNSRTIMELI